MLLDIKRSLYAIAKSFASIIVSYSIIAILKGEFVNRVLNTFNKDIANANNLIIFLKVVFFLVRLS
jgi:hypothetical protein